MDINLPGLNGVECVRLSKQSDARTFRRLCSPPTRTPRTFSTRQGRRSANGYLLKRAPRAELLGAIREVHRGGSPMTTHIARKVVQYFQRAEPSPQPGATLSAREQEVPGSFEPWAYSLQGNRRENGHQLRDRPHLYTPHLRKTPGAHPHRGGRRSFSAANPAASRLLHFRTSRLCLSPAVADVPCSTLWNMVRGKKNRILHRLCQKQRHEKNNSSCSAAVISVFLASGAMTQLVSL